MYVCLSVCLYVMYVCMYDIHVYVCICMYMYVYVCICMYMYVYVCICLSMSVYVCICMYMYVYVCICMYMYVYVCICMYMYVYVCICMYMYVYVCICMYMYVYVCICMYMYVYVCICMYMYVYVCICMYVCMYVRMYVCTYVRMYVCTYLRIYVCTYVRMYVCICICTYVCMYACVYVCMCVCVYVCMYVCIYIYINIIHYDSWSWDHDHAKWFASGHVSRWFNHFCRVSNFLWSKPYLHIPTDINKQQQCSQFPPTQSCFFHPLPSGNSGCHIQPTAREHDPVPLRPPCAMVAHSGWYGPRLLQRLSVEVRDHDLVFKICKPVMTGGSPWLKKHQNVVKNGVKTSVFKTRILHWGVPVHPNQAGRANPLLDPWATAACSVYWGTKCGKPPSGRCQTWGNPSSMGISMEKNHL